MMKQHVFQHTIRYAKTLCYEGTRCRKYQEPQELQGTPDHGQEPVFYANMAL